MGRLDSVLRMRVSLLPFEIYCLFQDDNLFLNLSSIESHVRSPKGKTQVHSGEGTNPTTKLRR